MPETLSRAGRSDLDVVRIVGGSEPVGRVPGGAAVVAEALAIRLGGGELPGVRALLSEDVEVRALGCVAVAPPGDGVLVGRQRLEERDEAVVPELLAVDGLVLQIVSTREQPLLVPGDDGRGPVAVQERLATSSVPLVHRGVRRAGGVLRLDRQAEAGGRRLDRLVRIAARAVVLPVGLGIDREDLPDR